MSSAVVGFATSLSLIVAIGAQNAFVLRQGLARRHVVPVVAVCAVADAVLIGAGIAGLGAALTTHPWALDVARYGGAAFVLGYGALAARRALRPSSLVAGAGAAATARAAVLACLGFTFLNPHVYLDTVVLLGALANQHGDDGRWLYGAGAMAASLSWFTALGFGARSLSAVFERPGAWRVLDGLIAVVMLAIGARLLGGT
ncbi:LysE/ArgO family amino acid transporter [Jiangella sp. DSM 45060]|uniref:LysE/ArgO family amino acid transporter n=1 Tax=Jiangella sp. DSM 45060 TaxID=1798224 RepID=UPI00087BC724|nr:LysE family transporter [Jiangella sp. DSM 45060]SDS64653.1 L-lysine exporter family protein LysE/ArgO [Jiangella sp. DSM 45060]